MKPLRELGSPQTPQCAPDNWRTLRESILQLASVLPFKQNPWLSVRVRKATAWDDIQKAMISHSLTIHFGMARELLTSSPNFEWPA